MHKHTRKRKRKRKHKDQLTPKHKHTQLYMNKHTAQAHRTSTKHKHEQKHTLPGFCISSSCSRLSAITRRSTFAPRTTAIICMISCSGCEQIALINNNF